MRRQSACVALATASDRPAWSGAACLPTTFEVADARSDGGTRRIDILEHEVMIERRIAGVRMRLAIPFTLYEGVALDAAAGPKGFGLTVSVRLVHEDRDLDIILFSAHDDRDVTAIWQVWAKRLGLPLLLADGRGGHIEPFARIGPLIVGRPRPRRVPSDFAKRRPRFLVRRRVGRPSTYPRIHAGREIIARD
jgi:hypothetical protein